MNRRISLAGIMVLMLLLALLLGTVSFAGTPEAMDVRGYSVAVSERGIPWVVWAADNGLYADLYYSRRQGEIWKAAKPL